ncbi:MAG: hypothetical protein AAF533_01185 [Acidobacteriota bacterium]
MTPPDEKTRTSPLTRRWLTVAGVMLLLSYLLTATFGTMAVINASTEAFLQSYEGFVIHRLDMANELRAQHPELVDDEYRVVFRDDDEQPFLRFRYCVAVAPGLILAEIDQSVAKTGGQGDVVLFGWGVGGVRVLWYRRTWIS